MSYSYSNPNAGSYDGPRRNSDNRHYDSQYYTTRGKIPAQVVSHTIRNGPPPPTTGKYRSGYPAEYRNSEGQNEDQYENFQSWERRDADKLYEYPIRLPGNPAFDYNRKSATKAQVERVVHPNDRRRLVQRPLNDPNFARAITDKTQRSVIGAIYHPLDKPNGFEKAPLEPLDRAGRQYLHTHKDQEVFRRETFPRR